MMYYRLVPHNNSFWLHWSQDPTVDRKNIGSRVSATVIQNGGTDEELRAFYLAIQVLIVGDEQQRGTLERVSISTARNIETGVKSPADYLEIYRYPAIVRNRKSSKKRNKEEMENYDELNNLLHTVFEPIKVKLKLPVVNRSEYSYSVPDSLIPAIKSEGCRNYLKSLVTYGVITEYACEKVISRLQRDYPENAEQIIAEMNKSKSRAHLSAISFNDSNGQLVVSMVNIHGDLLHLEGYKFLRLIEEHDNEKGGWLSLGFLERKETWLPEPLLKLNKEKGGELVAHYSAVESCLDVKCRVITDRNTNNTGIIAQAQFIIDQDYLVCLYVAIMKLKNDKQRFEELREKAETKEVTNMAGLEADLFN